MKIYKTDKKNILKRLKSLLSRYFKKIKAFHMVCSWNIIIIFITIIKYIVISIYLWQNNVFTGYKCYMYHKYHWKFINDKYQFHFLY